MSASLDLQVIASEVKKAQDRAAQFEPLTARYPEFDLPAAYEVARLIHLARVDEGATPVGRKIGFTNPDMWARYGVREPIWSHVYDSTVVHAPAGHAVCSLRAFTEPKIEPEIVFRLRSAPPIGEALDAILDCIDWVAHGFEIVQSHCPGWRFQAADTVADAALHASLLIGEPQPLARLGAGLLHELGSFKLTLFCNGSVRASGLGSNVLNHPLEAIAHLIGVLARQRKFAPLQAGEIVTTGTITSAQSIRAGQTWTTELQGIALPGFSVELLP
jgi:2-keto-4-pentenoate hydratase